MTTPTDHPSLYLVNGQPQSRITIDDRGLAYGDGLFETMRFKDWHLPAWSLHWQRLVRGAKVLGLKLDEKVICQYVEQVLDWAKQERVADGILKLIVTRGEGGQGYIPPNKAQATIILIAKVYQAASGDVSGRGVELKNCAYQLNYNPTLAGIKHLNRLEQVLAAQSVTLSDRQQGMVTDRDGRIIEALHHNLFLVQNNKLLTADLSFCGVAGVLRSAILEMFAPELKIPVAITDLYQTDLRAADEVFICNGVRGITPVNRWQDVTWQTGAVTQQLMHHISRRWKNLYDC